MPYVATRLGRWFYEDVDTEARAGAPSAKHDPAVVLLHGLLFDGGMWRAQVGPLAALGRVVVFDGPGHGRSEGPPPFTLEDQVSALVEALDRLGVARAVVVGLSWGGMLGMRLALAHPARVAALALLDTSADGTVLKDRLEYRALCALTRRIGLPPWVARNTIAPLMFGPTARAAHPELVDDFARDVSGYSREALTRAVTAVSIDRPSILDRIRDIHVPTLVGVGDEDVATPPDHARRIASRISGSTLVYFQGAGHLSALEAPALVNAALVPFVSEHLRRASA